MITKLNVINKIIHMYAHYKASQIMEIVILVNLSVILLALVL